MSISARFCVFGGASLCEQANERFGPLISTEKNAAILRNALMRGRTKVEVKAAERRAAANELRALEGDNRSKPTCKEVIKCCEIH
jgi:hypothetical protein